MILEKPGKVLITGISGFVGSHLCCELLNRGWQLEGFIREDEDLSKLADVEKNIVFRYGDLTDPESVNNAIKDAVADAVVHLAAESSPAKSFQDPEWFFEINTLGTLHLFEAARHQKRPQRILLMSSAEVYGQVHPSTLPVTEEAPLRPLNPYAGSKAACHYAAQQYIHHYGLPIIELRPFNLVGPDQDQGFVLPDFASQVAEIINGRKGPVLRVGRLTDKRDFLDVRDAAGAIADLLLLGQTGEVYNICSGVACKVQHLLDLLLDEAGIEIEIRQDESRLRPGKTPVLQGSHRKLTDLTGWRPQISLEKSVKDVLEYWKGTLS